MLAPVGMAGSHIQLAGRERQIQGLSERLLCLTGSLTSNVAAANYILQILHDDPSGKYDNVSTSYRGYVQAVVLEPAAVFADGCVSFFLPDLQLQAP